MHVSFSSKRLTWVIAPVALLPAFAFPTRAAAQAADQGRAEQDHIVSTQVLDQQLVTATETRQKNIDTLNDMLATPVAQKAMHDAKIDPVEVKDAIPTLSDENLANLSARAARAQSDFSAGFLGIGLLTLIILVIILVIVVSAVH